jgi:hypothetical protein
LSPLSTNYTRSSTMSLGRPRDYLYPRRFGLVSQKTKTWPPPCAAL